MTSLSVVVITLNEERNISRCLESVRAIADEIVVVDSGSSDTTPQICAHYGARFVTHPFEGHIQQKNFALTQCTHDAVLSIDADESLSPELCVSIARVKNEWTADGYSMNRLTNYCGTWIRHGGWYPDRKVRMFRKSQGAWTGVNPHDRFALSLPSARVVHLSGDLLHYSYYTVSDHLRQVDYFTGITAREMAMQGRSAGVFRTIVAPPFRFFRDYVIKGGWMDGYHGLVVAAISAHAVFIKYVKLRHITQQEHGIHHG